MKRKGITDEPMNLQKHSVQSDETGGFKPMSFGYVLSKVLQKTPSTNHQQISAEKKWKNMLKGSQVGAEKVPTTMKMNGTQRVPK